METLRTFHNMVIFDISQIKDISQFHIEQYLFPRKKPCLLLRGSCQVWSRSMESILYQRMWILIPEGWRIPKYEAFLSFSFREKHYRENNAIHTG